MSGKRRLNKKKSKKGHFKAWRYDYNYKMTTDGFGNKTVSVNCGLPWNKCVLNESKIRAGVRWRGIRREEKKASQFAKASV